MEKLFWIGFLGAAVAGLFAFVQAKKVLSYSEGSERMRKIAANIREGANAYLKHQYTTVFKVFAAVFAVLLVMAFASGGEMLSRFTPFAFVTGGVFSMLAGFIGMKIATNSNARTAQAASESLNKGLRVAFSSGSVMGFTVVGLGMLDVTMWFYLLRYAFGVADPVELGNIMVMNGMGASFMALFARVGGGIYTKAADVGADLVGKVEAGIPEDDPRNPAVIADNVGDNVGDVAGMGSDLFESYVGCIVSALLLAAMSGGAEILPYILGLVAAGILSSILGILVVKMGKARDAQATLNLGTYLSAVLLVIAAFFLGWLLPEREGLLAFAAVVSGITAGLLIGRLTEAYTSDRYKPVQEIAASCKTGAATNILSGLSYGMLSTVWPILVLAGATLASYYFCGILGIALAALGMLATVGMVISVDAYGPVADNAGGIAEMSGQPDSVREITDQLDSVGNKIGRASCRERV